MGLSVNHVLEWSPTKCLSSNEFSLALYLLKKLKDMNAQFLPCFESLIAIMMSLDGDSGYENAFRIIVCRAS